MPPTRPFNGPSGRETPMNTTPRRLGACILAVLACFLLVAGAAGRPAQTGTPVYQDPARPVPERVADLVSRMTLEEKVSQLMNDAAAIPRLDVPAYNWWNEALHGVARAGLATSFPQAIGLAATWDDSLIGEMAGIISDEARAKHHAFAAAGKRGLYQGLTFWSPNINIFRDPRWGRGMETYGEDPYLAGRLAVAFVKGMQGDDPKYLKTIATPKHYAVHSGPESERHVFDAVVDERDLQDTYLPQFEMAVREGGALSVMCAYNRFAGQACCASPRLLTDILRKEWGFAGYVVSDCGAIDDIYKTHKIAATAADASAMAIKAGCDLECGGSFKSLVEAVRTGKLAERDIDEAVGRLFTARFRLGLFDPPEMVKWARIPYSVVDNQAHRAAALRVARESIVLLKNDSHTLPLAASAKTIAVIGPNANDADVLLGNYNGIPSAPVTVLEGIRQGAPAGTTVLHAQGAPWAEELQALEVVPASALVATENGQQVPGLRGEYFGSAKGLSGTPVFTRLDPRVDFAWRGHAPDPRIPRDDDFAIRWTGELVAPVSGTYTIAANGMTTYRVSFDGKPLLKYSSRHEPATTAERIDLVAGRHYPISIELEHTSNEASIRLLWQVPGRDLQAEALDAARKADVVVMALGLSPRLEGEEMKVPVPGFKGGDRTSLDLPAAQQRLLEAVVGLGKPTVLVLLNGSALGVTWADEHVPAIVEAWYPGQAAGTAIADVLFGKYNPGGRLPITFYRSIEQLPPFGDYRMAGRTYRYFRGEALYPFGHGLSYSTFEYRNLDVPKTVRQGEAVQVAVDVHNAGARAGDEVVQLYVSALGRSTETPIRALKAFRRVSLAPGETRRITLEIAANALTTIGADGRRVADPGPFEIAVGGKQPGMTGSADAATTGVLRARMRGRV
jgi:beta-glucosidase